MDPIKRINFFDGLFLKEGEFSTEQFYHMHMRRRIYYMMFEQSGVVPLETDDLRIQTRDNATGLAGSQFRVSAGMAVSVRSDKKEGREIVLVEDTGVLDLDSMGVTSGTGYVTIHFQENPIEPQTGIDPNTETRWEEAAVIEAHSSWPPLTSPPDGEQYILLGQVQYSSMKVDDDPAGTNERHEAVLRSGLFGGGAAPPTSPSIGTMTLNPAAPQPGDTVDVTINGANLGGASATVNPSSGITVSAVTEISTAEIKFTLTIDSGAATGTRTLTVTTAHGSDSETFQIGSSATTPVIAYFDPPDSTGGKSGETIEVHGTNIRDGSLTAPFPKPASGTSIKIVRAPGDYLDVVGSTIEVQTNDSGGNQVVTFEMPHRKTTWGKHEAVTVAYTFGGTVEMSYVYNDTW